MFQQPLFHQFNFFLFLCVLAITLAALPLLRDFFCRAAQSSPGLGEAVVVRLLGHANPCTSFRAIC